jgi:hypothetical protein
MRTKTKRKLNAAKTHKKGTGQLSTRVTHICHQYKQALFTHTQKLSSATATCTPTGATNREHQLSKAGNRNDKMHISRRHHPLTSIIQSWRS